MRDYKLMPLEYIDDETKPGDNFVNVWAKLGKQKNDKLKMNILELKKIALMYKKFGMESQAAEINEILRAAEADPRLITSDSTVDT